MDCLVILETLGHVGWNGAKDGVMEGIPKVVPPLIFENFGF